MSRWSGVVLRGGIGFVREFEILTGVSANKFTYKHTLSMSDKLTQLTLCKQVPNKKTSARKSVARKPRPISTARNYS